MKIFLSTLFGTSIDEWTSLLTKPDLVEFGCPFWDSPNGKPEMAITDVAGVQVDSLTKNRGNSIRTGVTQLIPHQGNLFSKKCQPAIFVGKWVFGKIGWSDFQVQELGNLWNPNHPLNHTLSVAEESKKIVRYFALVSKEMKHIHPSMP